MTTQDANHESTLPLSKRRRVTRACDNCKSRKRRCNGEKPCAYCTEHRALCTYDAPYTRGKSDNVMVPVSRDEPTSPRGLSRWPHLARHSVASTNLPTSSHNSSPWPRSSLIQPAVIASEDDERAGAQSSRARSPIGGEGAAPMGQYLGPTSPFSVGQSLSLAQCVTPRNMLCSTLRKMHEWHGFRQHFLTIICSPILLIFPTSRQVETMLTNNSSSVELQGVLAISMRSLQHLHQKRQDQAYQFLAWEIDSFRTSTHHPLLQTKPKATLL
jgi:hypothetical protein